MISRSWWDDRIPVRRRRGLAVLAASLLLTTARSAPAAQWVPGPTMSVSRSYFALVPLPSGDLLAPGGVAPGAGYTNRVDIFSLAGRTFSETLAMPYSHRYQLQAVRLGNGKVLIAGEQYDGVAKEAHLFTESTHSWATTFNPPAINRFAGAMIVLPGGQGLYTGGYNGGANGPTYDSAELFDPASATWSNTGSMVALREGHTLTLLTTGPNAGKVLVAGGGQRIGLTVEARCELYDPATGLFALTGPLHTARDAHTATRLLDGRVLVTGGHDTGAAGDNHNTAEIYDPVTGTWSYAAAMSTRRARHTATLLLNGDVLVVGGAQVSSGSAVTASAEIYHPATDSWLPGVPAMGTARVGHSAALLPSGEVLVAGGNDGTTYLATSEIFVPGLVFYTLAPCRLIDTRQATSSLGGPALQPGDQRLFALAGACGLPSTARAVSGNYTVTGSTAVGFLTLGASDQALPATAAINYGVGAVRSNNAIAELSTEGAGRIVVFNGSAGSVQFILDVNGYFQ